MAVSESAIGGSCSCDKRRSSSTTTTTSATRRFQAIEARMIRKETHTLSFVIWALPRLELLRGYDKLCDLVSFVFVLFVLVELEG